jgi:hypothetical protein
LKTSISLFILWRPTSNTWREKEASMKNFKNILVQILRKRGIEGKSGFKKGINKRKH